MKISYHHPLASVGISTLLSLNIIHQATATETRFYPINFDDEEPIHLEPEEPLLTQQQSSSSMIKFQCPSSTFVGCTAINIDEWEHECSWVGESCDRDGGKTNEYCCVDDCGRNYCTAKDAGGGGGGGGVNEIVVVEKDEDDGIVIGGEAGEKDIDDGNEDLLDDEVVQDMPNNGKVVKAINDKATIDSGQPIIINVLFNDYIVQSNESQQGWGIPDFTTSLTVTEIVTNGIHGMCAITDNNSIIYIPNDYYASGGESDKCGYKVCTTEKDENTGEENCNFATVSITIAKQIDDAGMSDDDYFEATMEPRPWEVDEPTLVDPDTSLRGDNDDDNEGTVNIYDDDFNIYDDDFIPELDQAGIINIGEGEESVSWTLPVGSSGDCSDDETLLTVEMQTDQHGSDVKWEVSRDDDYTVVIEGGPYEQYSFDQVDVCLPSSETSLYTFAISDEWGDGLCDGSGVCGYYKLYLSGREIIHVTHYSRNNTHSIHVGYDPTTNMTQRHYEYLHAHNIRRQKWHGMYNKEYVPLVWSPRLAEDSLRWATQLLDECDSDDIQHEPGVMDGENLAKNKGLLEEDGNNWGQLYSADSECITNRLMTHVFHIFVQYLNQFFFVSFCINIGIVGRWVDREIGWPYPDNAHLTQS